MHKPMCHSIHPSTHPSLQVGGYVTERDMEVLNHLVDVRAEVRGGAAYVCCSPARVHIGALCVRC